MQNVAENWVKFGIERRLASIVAGVAILVLLLYLFTMISADRRSLLFGDLTSNQISEIVNILNQNNVDYEINGSSIYVDEQQKDQMRLLLASTSILSDSNRGYEILDELSGFGTTSQLFNAAYWRAKEGELARTISSSALIKDAKVYIANPPTSHFDSSGVTSASVFIYPSGGNINARNGSAIIRFVASAVPGLLAENVTLIDGHSGELVVDNSSEFNSESAVSEISQRLKRSVERILSAHLGAGNAIVELQLQLETKDESVYERTLSPEGQVVISSENTESSESQSGSRAGDVTVASNVPGGAGSNGSESNMQSAQTRERLNYDVSEVQREVVKRPGDIRRISAAVLVNGVTEMNDSGEEVWRPRTDEELEDLRQLVESAIGFDAARGDVVSIKSLRFQETMLPESDSLQSVDGGGGFMNANLLRFVVGAVVLLLLSFVLLKPMLSEFLTSKVVLGTPQPESLTNSESEFLEDSSSSTGELVPFDDQLLPSLDLPFSTADDIGSEFGLSDDASGNGLLDRLKEVSVSRESDVSEILRDWLK